MWASHYDIIVETLTGSEFEISVTDTDTIGYIKSRIQKDEGIPINLQHLLYNQKELNDAIELKDIPLVKGSRIKLVLNLKGGPVSARRVITIPDFDTTWFDLSEVLNKQDPVTITSPGVKLLVYKDCKKNFQRVMKFHAEKKNSNSESVGSDPFVAIDRQFLKDNLNTMEKMYQVRAQLEGRKKGKPSKNKKNGNASNTSSNRVYESRNPNQNNYKKRSDGTSSGHGFKETKPFEYLTNKPEENTSKMNNYVVNYCRQQQFSTLNGTPPMPKLSTSKYYFSNAEVSKKYSHGTLRNAPNMADASLLRHSNSRTCIRSPLLVPVPKHTDIRNSLLSNNTKISTSDRRNNRTSLDYENNKFKSSNAFIKSSIPMLSSITLTPDAYRLKVRDNMCRNRSYKSMSSMGNLTERDNITIQRKDYQRRQHDLSNNNNLPINFNRFPIINSNTITASYRPATSKDINNSNFYHFYKMTDDAKNYEFPKLLIKEGSPFESFHSANAQCETLTILDTSPADRLVIPAATSNTAIAPSNTDANPRISTASHVNSLASSTLETPPRWSHHHSELDLKNLRLTFYSEDMRNYTGNSYLNKTMSVLKIASNLEINKWDSNSMSSGAFKVGNSPYSSMSLHGYSNSTDGFSNSCELLRRPSTTNSATKLNEISMMFGSSPTVLNNKYILKTPKLNAIPVQYRRGYLNLNNACLSNSSSVSNFENMQMSHTSHNNGINHISSTRSMESMNNLHGMNSATTSRNNSRGTLFGDRKPKENFSLLRYRRSGSVDYGKCYEPIDSHRNSAQLLSRKTGQCNNCTDHSYNGSSRNIKCHKQPIWNPIENTSIRKASTSSRDTFSDFDLALDNDCEAPTNFFKAFKAESRSSESLNYDDVLDWEPVNFDKLISTSDILINDKATSSVAKVNHRPTIHLATGVEVNNAKMKEIHICTNEMRLQQTNMSLNSSDLIECAKTNSSDFAGYTNSTSAGNEETNKVFAQTATVANVPDKPKKLRCAQCNKKLGVIMIMKCHCEQVFCAQHRYAEAHNCTYDYKLEGQKVIARENPLVVAQKLSKL